MNSGFYFVACALTLEIQNTCHLPLIQKTTLIISIVCPTADSLIPTQSPRSHKCCIRCWPTLMHPQFCSESIPTHTPLTPYCHPLTLTLTHPHCCRERATSQDKPQLGIPWRQTECPHSEEQNTRQMQCGSHWSIACGTGRTSAAMERTGWTVLEGHQLIVSLLPLYFLNLTLINPFYSPIILSYPRCTSLSYSYWEEVHACTPSSCRLQ